MSYRTIDLCAGIGGIRKGFEMTGYFENVLSAEIDKYACMTYQHLYDENPYSDLTTESFKKVVEETPYDVLLAGFPCQTFSRAGLGEGFANEEKGIIFFHIAEIIKRTRPKAVFLENVDHLTNHEKGETFKTIIEILEDELNYKIIGVTRNKKNEKIYNPENFIRNSRDFGVPQNRPRTYIIGFDRLYFNQSVTNILVNQLPLQGDKILYNNLNEVLEENVDLKYYMASGYLNTLFRHRERQRKRGNGFGYRIVNKPENVNPVANTLLATGGSGKERNLIYDPRDDVAGAIVGYKKTPLNEYGIRIMTPIEWGKLQGFINYAFLEDNVEKFSFPKGISDAQRYKQFGNSVTIPVIEKMALFMIECFDVMFEEMKEVIKV